MSHQPLIILLVVIAIVYLLFKKPDPYQEFKNWLDRNPQQKSKLEPETWDQFFIDPEMEDIRPKLWKMATDFQTPLPDDLLPGNKIIVPIIRAYLREQKGIVVSPTLVKK